jgi:glycosyltransferase involved in cell wall biosynthesis
MRILHILALGPVGGLPRVVEALALGQQRQGHEVHVVVVREPGEGTHPMLETLRAAGVGLHPVVLRPRAYLRERAEVAAHCRRLWPHLVHTHGYRSDVVAAPVARGLGLPVVTTVHGFTGGGWKNRFYEVLQRRAMRRFDAVAAVSRHLAGELARSGIAPERIHTVPKAWSGIPVPLERAAARRALGIRGDRLQIGWVGRLSHEKGPDTLIAALTRLRHLPCAASFLGDGAERLRLERITSSSELAWRVRWHGVVPEAGRYISAFDLFVLSSRTEGMPIALFEALAAGVPILATGVGGVPEVITAREALLVPADDPAALALAVQAVFDDPRAAAVRAHAARERLARDFTLESCLEAYDSLYRELRPEYRLLVPR